MNSIRKAVIDKGGRAINVYFTAGHPTKDSVVPIIEALDAAGVDLIELGMPYSDPLADGLTIQKSSETALLNGMNLRVLFDQIKEATAKVDTPIILMGYFNQVLQFGATRFLDEAANAGVSGMIIPDLPMPIYRSTYQKEFEARGLSMSFLISPMTSEERIIEADELSTGFLYMVSQSSITGKTGDISEEQLAYFNRVKELNLKSPRLIGFGIHDKTTFDQACDYSDGAIVGSAFIRAVENDMTPEGINQFITSIVA